MAAIFKVPLEVRDLIYEELLVYRGGAIKLQESKPVRALPMHPVVLRLCKQSYDEAGKVLWERNHFLYEVSRMIITSSIVTGRGDHVPDRCFAKIKHLEILVETMFQSLFALVGQRIVAAISYFNATLPLTTLQLSFIHLDEIEGETEWREHRQVRKLITQFPDLLNAIATTNPTSTLKLQIQSLGESKCRMFDAFAQQVAELKHWGIKLQCTRSILEWHHSWDEFENYYEDDGDDDGSLLDAFETWRHSPSDNDSSTSNIQDTYSGTSVHALQEARVKETIETVLHDKEETTVIEGEGPEELHKGEEVELKTNNDGESEPLDEDKPNSEPDEKYYYNDLDNVKLEPRKCCWTWTLEPQT